MKLEHFTYKPDGLYYIPEMPSMEDLYCDCKICRDSAVRNYNGALEPAKAEAVKVDDNLKYLVDSVLYKDTDTVKEDEIYTINVEEEIEVIRQKAASEDNWEDIPKDDTPEEEYQAMSIHGATRKIARIAAPKVEESQESIIRFLLNTYADEWDFCNPEVERVIINEIKKNFEIKRKI